MKKFVIAGALALAAATGTAQAAPVLGTPATNGTSTVSVSYDVSSTAVNPSGTNVIYNFDNMAVGTSLGFNSAVTNSSAMGTAVRPAVFSSGNYAAAGGAGNFTLNFGATNILSFALGSLDQYNTLTLLFNGGSSLALTDGAIVGGLSALGRDGVVTYTVLGGPQITGVNFASAANAFEIDNVAVGVPEPAAWGMMILGFGLVGGVLRRRSTAKVKFA